MQFETATWLLSGCQDDWGREKGGAHNEAERGHKHTSLGIEKEEVEKCCNLCSMLILYCWPHGIFKGSDVYVCESVCVHLDLLPSET